MRSQLFTVMIFLPRFEDSPRNVKKTCINCCNFHCHRCSDSRHLIICFLNSFRLQRHFSKLFKIFVSWTIFFGFWRAFILRNFSLEAGVFHRPLSKTNVVFRTHVWRRLTRYWTNARSKIWNQGYCLIGKLTWRVNNFSGKLTSGIWIWGIARES